MAEQEAFVVPQDLWANEDCSEEALRCYVAPPLNQAMIAAVQEALGGLSLPQAYVALARQQNGGLLQRRYFVLPYSLDELEAQLAQGQEPELSYVTLTNIFGIGATTPWSLCGEFGTAFMISKWGYPNLGAVIAGCSDFGHSMVWLDYQGSSEPSVVLVQKDFDFRKRKLAPSFADFIAQLKTESELKQAQRDFAQACDEVRYKLIAQRKEAEAKRVAAGQEKLAQEQLAQEKAAQEKADKERAEQERAEQERRAQEKAEQERRAQARAEQEKRAQERAERERAEQEQSTQEKTAQRAATEIQSEQVPMALVQKRLSSGGMVHSKHDFAVRARSLEQYRQSVLTRLGSRPFESLSGDERAQLDAVDMVQGTGFKDGLVHALMNSSSFAGAEGMLRLLVGELVAHRFSPNAQETPSQRRAYEHLVRRDLMALLLCLELENHATARSGRFWLHFDDETWQRLLGYLPQCYRPSQKLTLQSVTPADVLSYSGKAEGFGLLEPLDVGELVDFINELSENYYHCAIMQNRSNSQWPNFELGLPPSFRNDVLTNISNFMAANYPDTGVALIAQLLDQQCYGSCLNNVLFGGLAQMLPQSMLFDVAQAALILEQNCYALSLMRDQVEGQSLYLALYIMGMAYYGMCRSSLEQQRRIVLFSKKQEQRLTSIYENMALPRPELARMARDTNNDIPLFARKALEALGTYQQLQVDSNQERLTLARQAQSYLQHMLESVGGR